MGILPSCTSVQHAPAVRVEASCPLELELQMVLNHPVGAGN